MNNINVNIWLTLGFFLLLNITAFSQNETKPKNTGEVTIIAPYQPSIQDARKINISPEIEVKLPEKKKLDYSINPQKMTTNIELEPMKAVRVKKEDTSPMLTNFIKGGFGTYTTAYGELFSTSKQSDEYRLGLHLKHFSRNGKIDDVANPQNSNNLAKVFGEKYYDNYSIYASLFFNRNVYHYYGFNPKDPLYDLPNDDSIRQRLVSYGGNFRIESIENDDFFYSIDAGYKGWQNIDEIFENIGHIHSEGKKYVDWFDFLSDQAMGCHLDYNLYHSDYNFTKTYNTLSIRPFLDFESGVYSIKLGINMLGINTIKENDDSKFDMFVFPNIETKIKVVPDYFAIIGGISGYHKYMGYDNLTSINPYITNNIEREITRYNLDAFVGFSGNIFQYADYTLSLRYQDVSNYPLFVINKYTEYNNNFLVNYKNIEITNLHAGFGLNQWKDLFINASFNYYMYDVANDITPWYLPEFTTDISAKYLLEKMTNIPLSLTLKANLQIGRKARDLQNETITLDNIIDVSLHTDYYINKRFTAFLHLNNLLNQRYYDWYNYPNYRFNALIGASYSF